MQEYAEKTLRQVAFVPEQYVNKTHKKTSQREFGYSHHLHAHEPFPRSFNIDRDSTRVDSCELPPVFFISSLAHAIEPIRLFSRVG